MKIVFLNAWGREMRAELVPYLEDLSRDTDIFCLQEATSDMKRQCESAFIGFSEHSYAKNFEGKGHFSQSIFVRDGLGIGESGVLLAEDAELGLMNYVEIKRADTSLWICNVHGTAWPSDKLDDARRLRQSQELIDFFEDKPGDVIIGGDFNIMPHAQSIGMFSHAGYKDLIHDFKIDTTRNHFAWDRFDTKMFYSDYVFLSSGIEITSFAVPKNEVSDHLPMLVEING